MYLCTTCVLFYSFQSVRNQCYDHHSAVYHLLLDKLRRHSKASVGSKVPSMCVPSIPIAFKTERRSSITTGVGMYCL